MCGCIAVAPLRDAVGLRYTCFYDLYLRKFASRPLTAQITKYFERRYSNRTAFIRFEIAS